MATTNNLRELMQRHQQPGVAFRQTEHSTDITYTAPDGTETTLTARVQSRPGAERPTTLGSIWFRICRIGFSSSELDAVDPRGSFTIDGERWGILTIEPSALSGFREVLLERQHELELSHETYRNRERGRG